MAFNPNSLSTNILVTILTVVMVIVLPWVDKKICDRLGLSLSDGYAKNPKADKLMHIRKILLIVMFMVYLALVGYVTFFSRSAADDYRIHIAPFADLADAIKIDFGVLGFIGMIFRDGLPAALAHVRVQHLESIAQVYMNICMFIPLGYLLPYIFDWFRRHVIRRVVTVSFLASLLIENLQLISKRGFYDIDDLFTNTFGGFLGALLYIAFAYVLAHPDFRQELKTYRLWRKEAVKSAMFPFFKKVRLTRSTVFANDSQEILDYYVTVLGMYLRSTIYDKDTEETRYLLEYGRNQMEVRCSKSYSNLPEQSITLACNNSEYLKRRLDSHGVNTSEYVPDPFTGLRTYQFKAPANVTITIIEE
ncbi:MAG: VanZ family protein [Erysipelotrichaceae bacterium]|nr:VanZ family protein [Erysipelotrichaceae bacterium]